MQAATIVNATVKSFNQIPRIKPSIPIFGNTWQYFKGFGRYSLHKLHEANEDKYYRYGPIVIEEFVPGTPVVHIFDPIDFQMVFRSQGKYPNRPPNEFVRHYRLSRPDRYSTIGMAHSQGQEWLEERSKLAPLLLKSSFVENNLPSQNEICNNFVRFINNFSIESTGDENTTSSTSSFFILDVKECTDRLALESIVNLCLGIQIGCFSSKEEKKDSSFASILIEATKELFESYNKLYYGPKTWKLVSTSAYKSFTKAEDSIYDLASEIMKSELEKRKIKSKSSPNVTNDSNGNVNGKYTSILNYLLEVGLDDSSSIAVTVADFVAGGTFTVSTSLTYALYHLSRHPNVQEQLHAEIVDVLRNSSKDNSSTQLREDELTFDHLSRMSYLKACIKESFRLTPTTPAVVRVLEEDAVLSGYHVPKGVTVFSHFLVTCRLEKYFNQPLTYKPDRWLDKSQRSSTNPFSLLPFGFGNRMCVGRRFSEIQLYLALAKIALNYKLEPLTASLDLRHAFVVVPSHKVAIRFIPRFNQGNN